MTTLELAEKIALAVMDECDLDVVAPQMYERPKRCARAVLGVLYDTDHWFCRIEDDRADLIVPLERPANPNPRLPFAE